VVHDITHDRLAAHAEQRLRCNVGVRSKPGAHPGKWNHDFHDRVPPEGTGCGWPRGASGTCTQRRTLGPAKIGSGRERSNRARAGTRRPVLSTVDRPQGGKPHTAVHLDRTENPAYAPANSPALDPRAGPRPGG